MNERIAKLLEELYLIDPSLRDEEEKLKKTIEELLSSKPEGKMDEAFEAELKEKLLAEFSKETERKKAALPFLNRFIAKPAARIGLGAAAAAAILVGVYLGLGSPWRGEVQVASAAKQSTSIAFAPPKPEAQAAPAQQAEPQREYDRLQLPSAKDKLAKAVQDEALRQGLRAETAAEAMPSAPAPKAMASGALAMKKDKTEAEAAPAEEALANRYNQDFDTEGYDRIIETSFAKVLEEPLSTFSIDVDTASYANVRRFLNSGFLPPPDAVRIEELVNYFPYDYAGPSGDESFAFDTELSACPWDPAHSLLRVALQAKRIAARDIPPCNLVFLIDVSGSMEDENKLPLLKESLKILARRMRQEDRIAIVVYAGSAGVALESTPGNKVDRIVKAIDGLESGGSTAGGEGIKLAYELAKKGFIPKGSNRVILATDGDFNVGASSDGELVRIIEEERKSGVFLSVLGFGMGNYQDSKMQKLADSGNGNYAYVDSLSEADKVLSKQMAGTLFTVAKDVKVQIEFNPARVGEYRLIGYEKRALAARDFADDTKDAGELGAGSSVTALYELIPPAGASSRGDLRYQSSGVTAEAAKSKELMTLKFRYKKPNGSASSLVEKPVEIAERPIKDCSADFRFAAAVAEWGLVLRDSAYKGKASLDEAASLARGARGKDAEGYRAEFLELVELSKKLSASSTHSSGW
jgi:Ca-activated chloride channel family protein